MAVSHHDDPAMYKTYVINSSHVDHTFFSETSSESRSQLLQKNKMYAVDPERDAHIGRSMNLFASGFYQPPVAPSLPMAIETIKQETSSELEDLKKGQARIMMISMFLPQQIRSAPKFIHNHDFLFEGFHRKY